VKAGSLHRSVSWSGRRRKSLAIIGGGDPELAAEGARERVGAAIADRLRKRLDWDFAFGQPPHRFAKARALDELGRRHS
jgi:hypothetical protein